MASLEDVMRVDTYMSSVALVHSPVGIPLTE